MSTFSRRFWFKHKYLVFTLAFGLLLYFIVSLSNRTTIINFSNFHPEFQNSLTAALLPIESLFITKKLVKDNLDQLSNSVYEKLSNPSIKNHHWRLFESFVNNKIGNDIGTEYIKTRETQHLYDPRITFSVYLNELNRRFMENDNTIPFSWEDWVDLSYLNRYLGESKLSCSNFYKAQKITTSFKAIAAKSNEDITSYCLDDEDYLLTDKGKLRNPQLLPGFNFKDRIEQKSTFIAKAYGAKSYLLSYAEPPSFIYFLNDKGTYFKAKPYPSKSMIENGMLNKFLDKKTGDFDPIFELENIKQYASKDENNFMEVLAEANFKLDIPESKFELDFQKQFEHLYTNRQSLEEFESQFLDSLDYSMGLGSNFVPKHFKEVNLVWPANYRGHRLVENGAHYDARFFSGLVTEMPNPDITVHSPWFKGEVEFGTQDNAISRRNSILSHTMHTLLSLSFHNGLIMFPAHGSLLGWYFTGTAFPWDSDGDVQMPIADLAELCLRFNNSMIVQNPKYGMSKYFLDCTSSLTHRIKGNGKNNIDARFIDIDSGLFIDVTGLSVSGEILNPQNWNELSGWVPKSFRKDYPMIKTRNDPFSDANFKSSLVNLRDPKLAKIQLEAEKKIYDIHKKYHIYNCRNRHYYPHAQLSPARLTLFEGAPTFVATDKKSLRAVITNEYKETSLSNPAWDQWVYSKSLRLWIHAEDVYNILLQNDIKFNRFLKKTNSSSNIKKNVKGPQMIQAFVENEAFITSELIKRSVFEITHEASLETGKTLRFNIIDAVFHSMSYSSAHSREMAIFDSSWEWSTPKLDDSGTEIPTDWRELAEWILEDHSPAKMPLLDFLIFTENDTNQKEDETN